MQTIGAFEAKNKFAEILRRVESGEEFCVTRHGKIIARISAPETDHKENARESFAKLRRLRARLQLTPEDVAAFRSEGRP